MKTLRHFISIFGTLFLILTLPGMDLWAQEKPAGFDDDVYKDAIQNIVSLSGGTLHREKILDLIVSGDNPDFNPLLSPEDSIYTNPQIAVISYNEISATFNYSPENIFTNDSVGFTFPANNPDWEIPDSLTIDTTAQNVTFYVDANTTYIARSAAIQSTRYSVNDTITHTSYILQEPAPQKFIFVSPKNQAVAPEGGTTEPFTVTTLPVFSWKAVFDEDWIGVDSTQLTSDTIVFLVTANESDTVRSATVKIEDAEDSTTWDELTIFQYVDTSNYIIAAPSSGFISSDSNDFFVTVNSNIQWEVVYTDVPSGMIQDSVVSENSVNFHITINTTPDQRTAKISLTGTDHPTVSAEIEIIQSGESAPYIYVSPPNSYLESNQGNATLLIDANVDWEIIYLDVPDGMISDSIINSSKDSVTFTVSENTGIESRVAVGAIRALGNPSPVDTFRIIQEASFIILNPSETLISCNDTTFMVHITRHNVDSVLVDSSGFFGDVQIFGNDSLRITVPENEGATPRSHTISVCSFENPSICKDLLIFQDACNQAYITITPKFHNLPYQGGVSDAYLINSDALTDWEVFYTDTASWVTDSVIVGATVRFDVAKNTKAQTREFTFQIRSTSDATILDSAIIFQDGAPSPILLASPREQITSHNGNDSLDFTITYQNIDNWMVEASSVPNWILVDSAGGNLLSLDVDTNDATATRQALIHIHATDSILIRDSIFVYQYSALDSYILAAPRSDTVLFYGDTNTIFTITHVNPTGNWKVDESSVPSWIQTEKINETTLKLNVNPNPDPQTRDTIIWIFDEGNLAIRDSISIYQYAAPESYILASPRADTVNFAGAPNNVFTIKAVNLKGQWIVDPASVPAWIQTEKINDITLKLDIHQNLSSQTRDTTIRIFDEENPAIRDSISIYQYAAPESYILASPRADTVNFSGDPNDIFTIKAVNLAGQWVVETGSVPSWIQTEKINETTLRLDINPNFSSQTRDTTIWVFDDGNPDIRDSISIYQYAAPESYILASPRADTVSFAGDPNDVFTIKAVNLEGQWVVDMGSVPTWIQTEKINDATLKLDVNPNFSSQTRDTTIWIFDDGNPENRDSISIYQYAAPESYILASPRADTVNFAGDPNDVFTIKAVNLDGQWIVDAASVPSWIQTEKINETTLKLDVNPNPTSQTRDTTIWIFDDGNTSIRDSISIYQYAAPEKYILAAPREQIISHPGGSLIFNISPINVDIWGVDTTTIPEWIPDFSIIENTLVLSIESNEDLQTRETNIRIFADSAGSNTEDSISIYQYSGLDHYLLASPRERKVGNLSDTIYFKVDTVNLSSWQTQIIGDASTWIEALISGADTLGLVISENNDSITRTGKVRLYSDEFPNAEDIVDIYQYSAFEPYIILEETHNIEIPYLGDTLDIILYSNLDSIGIENGNQANWYNFIGDNIILPINNTSTIQLVVDENPDAYLGRSAFLKFMSNNIPDTTVFQNFYFQQLINPTLTNVTLSGYVKHENAGLDNVNIILGDTLISDQNGYFDTTLQYGWVGIVTPEKVGFYFDPPNAVFNIPLKKDSTINFEAIKIEPQITFNIEGDTLSICPGEQVDSLSANYPRYTESGTYGPRTYKWYSNPPDTNLNTDTTTSPAWQVFSPQLTTTYYLVLYNYETSDTASFTVAVFPAPVGRIIDGSETVCRNQAGVIYLVDDFAPGEYFSWKLRYNNQNMGEYFSNIAVIDWGSMEGEYELSLFTYNAFGCNDSIAKTITVTAHEAPPKTSVKKKEGDNMLLCLNDSVELYNYAWGWYTLNEAGLLNEKYIIPNKNDWYCRLPESHAFDPITYKYFVSLTFKNGGSCESISFLYDNAPVGFSDDNAEAFTIFPNPTHGTIRVKFSNISGNESLSCRILNISGQTVYLKSWDQIISSEIEISKDTHHLTPGLYFIRLELGTKTYNSKIVVQ